MNILKSMFLLQYSVIIIIEIHLLYRNSCSSHLDNRNYSWINQIIEVQWLVPMAS